MPSTKRWFSVKGLSIYSEVPLPAGFQAIPIRHQAELQIVIDPFLKHGIDPGKFHTQWSRAIATVCVPDVGVLRMIGGERIIVSPYAGADEERLQQFILDDGIHAILAQRSFSDEDRMEKEVLTAYGSRI